MSSSIETLVEARRSLKQSLEKSRALGSALERAGPRLDEIHQRLPSLEAAVRPIRAQKGALAAVGGHIDRAVGPAAAVLKVFDAVHGLEKSLLSDPRSDLWGYLSVLKRLEEALRFLSANCGLAIQWLEDILDYLEDNSVADDRYLSNLKKSLNSLKEMQSDDERARLDGGLLDAALDKLEIEFRRLVTENSVPLPMMSSSPIDGDNDQQPCIAPSPLPGSVIQKLQLILERLTANNRLESCISIYVDVRSSNVKASLQPLELDYLDISLAEFNDVESIEDYIARWGKHLEFAVKHLFEAEFKLCSDVFEKMGADVSMGCFSKIAAQAGILAFLQFGKTVTESKKDPIKLLKLLDIFASLNKLRLDFNRLFGGKACVEIQNTTRDLIKAVIEGACDIFWELLVQVELQRQTLPPPNGTVPRLVSFITDYCNRLLGDDYRPVLTQVLVIHRSWRQERFQERLLIDAILNIIKALELNLETWAKGYEDTTLSHLFLMNNHWHLFKHLKGTKLGELLGDAWLREHEQYKDYFSAIYMRDSWAKLPALLSREGLILFSGGRATARDLVKKRLKAFNEAFDEMYKKQSNWFVPDRDLREKTCQSIVQTILPVYRSYMQNYGPLVEQDASASKYAKYTVQTLETMLGSLFQQKLVKYGSAKARHSNGKLNSLVTSQFCSAPPTVM
ncbi:exocyst complex component EXO70A1 [Cinnamomum micranthum f. kanehirae]|uniref:Exocyst subunit Exo70 family protein n=1 Tax=Cinnamomum micranthum f. kanehirae TaxID=337451 RepID=A0A443PL43_9MAGN|nr:exocyst complex component EXO70A1 [Cinnamomum micranthum f. kanehirae]